MKRKTPAPYRSNEAIVTVEDPQTHYMRAATGYHAAITHIKRKYNIGSYSILLLCGFKSHDKPATLGVIDRKVVDRPKIYDSCYVALWDLVSRGYLQKVGERRYGGMFRNATLFACTIVGKVVAEEYLMMLGQVTQKQVS